MVEFFFYRFLKKRRILSPFRHFDKSVVVETELEIHRRDRSSLLYDSFANSDYQEIINEMIAIYRRLL